MTNTIAIFLAALILGLLALDQFVLEWGLPTFAMRHLIVLIEYLAFWR